MSAKIITPATYLVVFTVLLVLLVLTVVAAQFDFGWANIFIAMGIAGAKAAVIVLYFMHVRYSHPLVKVFAGAGMLWAAFGAMLTLQDYFTRGWLEPPLETVEMRAVDRVLPGPEVQKSPSVAEPRGPQEGVSGP